MNLFVGVAVPAEVGTYLGGKARECSHGEKDTFERVDDMHITLRYIGEGDEKVVDQCLSRIRFNRFRLNLSRMGTFLNPHENVLWCGVEDIGRNLNGLFHCVDDALTGVCRPYSYDSYRPHISMVFGESPASIETKNVESLSFAVDSFILYEIREDRNCQRFVPYRTYPLYESVPLLVANDYHSSMKHLVSFMYAVRRFQEQNPGTVTLFGGDNYWGNPRCGELQGRPVSEMMQSLGVSYSAIGNHDYEGGLEYLKAREQEGGFRFLASNLEPSGLFQPSAVVEVKGRRIGIIGYANADQIPSPEMDSSMDGITILPPEAHTPYLLKTMEASGVDAVVALTHYGLKKDASSPEETAIRHLAETYPEFDAVFGAHLHQFVSCRIGNVPLLEGGSHGRGFAVLQILFDEEGHKAAVIPSVVELEGLEGKEDTAALRILSRMVQDTPAMDQVLFTMEQPILSKAPESDLLPLSGSDLGQTVVHAIQKTYGPDGVLFYQGRMGRGFERGPVTRARYLEVMFFENRLYRVELKGREVRKNLETGMRTLKGESKSPLAVAGFLLTVDPEAPFGYRILSVEEEAGSPLSDDKVYTLVVDDFLISGGAGFDFRSALKVEKLDESVRSLMEKFFSSKATWNTERCIRTKE